jgi:CRP-like cAMP-binding protein
LLQLLADVCWRTSAITEHPSGKHVLVPGTKIKCMYFVMKGRLHVVAAEPPHRTMHVLATRDTFGFEALDRSLALVESTQPLVVVDRIEAAEDCLLLELPPVRPRL